MRFLFLFFFHFIYYFYEQEVLILDGNDLGMEGAVNIAEKIPQNSGLIQLELKDNAILDSGAACIAYALRRHPTLRTLDLTCNSITSGSIEQIAKYLIGDPDKEVAVSKEQQKKKIEKMLECLHFSDELYFRRFFARYLFFLKFLLCTTFTKKINQDGDEVEGHHLQTLILNSNLIGNEGAYFIADSLAVSKNLQSLQLRGCGIQTEGVRTFLL